MIHAIALILACQLCGEVVVRLLGLPIPGPLMGAVLLAALLIALRRIPAPVETTARTILQHLSLLFVPAAVGVIEYREVFLAHGPALLLALVGSTAVALVVAVLVFRLLSRSAP